MKLKRHRVTAEPVRVSRNGKRFFSEAHKRAVVEQCLMPGASVAAVAMAHGFNANLVRKWIDKHKGGRGHSGPGTALVPVTVVAGPAKSRRKAAHAAGASDAEVGSGWIELEIGTARLIVRGKIEALQLRAVLEALQVWR